MANDNQNKVLCQNCGHEHANFVIVRDYDVTGMVDNILERLHTAGYAAIEDEVLMMVHMVLDEIEGPQDENSISVVVEEHEDEE